MVHMTPLLVRGHPTPIYKQEYMILMHHISRGKTRPIWTLDATILQKWEWEQAVRPPEVLGSMIQRELTWERTIPVFDRGWTILKTRHHGYMSSHHAQILQTVKS